MLHLYDSSTQSITPFGEPSSPVTLYVCGITPYDATHLGHAFTYHVFDTLARRMRSLGHTVQSVRNITDVDDDIYRAAERRGTTPEALVAGQVERFEADMKTLGIADVTAPRASSAIPEMVKWISRIEEHDFTYVVEGWVYFDSQKYGKIGSLSHLPHAEMVAKSLEVEGEEAAAHRRHELDIVLWRPAIAGRPSWPSLWGEGRPGWHIECTALALSHLGEGFSLHGGGSDLLFPHHEYEEALALAAGAGSFAKRWMHVSMVRNSGEKMSKSLGNTVFVQDLLRDVPPAALRLYLCNQHYRKEWEHDSLQVRFAEGRRASYLDALSSRNFFSETEAREYESEFLSHLDDDLDTAGALHVLDAIAVAALVRNSDPRSGRPASAVITRALSYLGITTDMLAAAPAPVG